MYRESIQGLELLRWEFFNNAMLACIEIEQNSLLACIQSLHLDGGERLASVCLDNAKAVRHCLTFIMIGHKQGNCLV
jgi:hypothetical protein